MSSLRRATRRFEHAIHDGATEDERRDRQARQPSPMVSPARQEDGPPEGEVVATFLIRGGELIVV